MAEDVSKKKYSYLDQLSTEELEAVLRASALSEEADDPDLIDHILEVIVLREKEKNDVLEVEHARKDFDELYRNLDNPLYPTAEDEVETAESRGPYPSPQAGKRRNKHILIAAVVFVALISLTCIPVLGYDNIIQMVAHWTADQFGFCPQKSVPRNSSDSAQIPEEYVELQSVMQQLGAQLIIPNIPDEFEAGDPVLSYSLANDTLEYMLIYQKEEEYYIFGINWNGNLVTNQYEKDETLVETFLYNDITHYVLSNASNNTVAWYSGKAEYYIVTNRPVSELKAILETTYEVK